MFLTIAHLIQPQDPAAPAQSWNAKGALLDCQNVLFSYKCSHYYLYGFYCLSQQLTARPRSLLFMSSVHSSSNKGRSSSLIIEDRIMSPIWTYVNISTSTKAMCCPFNMLTVGTNFNLSYVLNTDGVLVVFGGDMSRSVSAFGHCLHVFFLCQLIVAEVTCWSWLSIRWSVNLMGHRSSKGRALSMINPCLKLTNAHLHSSNVHISDLSQRQLWVKSFDRKCRLNTQRSRSY